jgi:hypothetical protein
MGSYGRVKCCLVTVGVEEQRQGLLLSRVRKLETAK